MSSNESSPLKCPSCGSLNIAPYGISESGKNRKRCKDCGRQFVINPEPVGRPMIGEQPLTNAERCRRYREKIKAEFAARAQEDG